MFHGDFKYEKNDLNHFKITPKCVLVVLHVIKGWRLFVARHFSASPSSSRYVHITLTFTLEGVTKENISPPFLIVSVPFRFFSRIDN